MRIDDNVKVTSKKIPIPKEEDGMLDMIIAFDTTGSMSSYIKNVKQYVHDLIPTLFSDNPNLRLGIVAFGDYCDKNVDGSFGNAYQCLPLCNNVDAISKFVKNAKNTYGGDHPEFYELVIKKNNRRIRLERGCN